MIRIAIDNVNTDIINNVYNTSINNGISSNRHILIKVIHDTINGTIININCIIDDSINTTNNNINSHNVIIITIANNIKVTNNIHISITINTAILIITNNNDDNNVIDVCVINNINVIDNLRRNHINIDTNDMCTIIITNIIVFQCS